MNDFYNSYYKNNKISRVISTILAICLIVSSLFPANVFADPLNIGGSGGSGTIGGGAKGSTSISRGEGGYRFTLIFLSGDAGGSDIMDDAGNVNIDVWSKYSDDIYDFGTLDVYLDGEDSQSYQYFDGSAFYFDLVPENSSHSRNRVARLKKGDSRKMLSLSQIKDRGINNYHYIKDGNFDFSWQINNTYGQQNIGQVLGTLAKDENGNNIEISQDLYPSVEGSHTYKGYKYAPTEECATIITALCNMNVSGIDVKCESVVGKDNVNEDTDNIFERGVFHNPKTGKKEIGSYRLLVEPYEVINVESMGKVALTLRDSLWLCSVISSASPLYDGKFGGKLANNVGGDLSIMANATYMPDKDVFYLNKHIPYQPNVENISDLTKLALYDRGIRADGTSAKTNRTRMTELKAFINDQKYGYGIGSFTSDMCRTVANDMFIGSVSHLFLPGTLNNNDKPVAYSIEYRGSKADVTKQGTKLEDTAETIIKAIGKAQEPDGLSGTDAKSALSKLPDNYDSLTENIVNQIEDMYAPDEYSADVKALAKDVIKNNNFKDFIETIYYNNVIGMEEYSDGQIANTPVTDWCKTLILQTMIDNGNEDLADGGTDSALSITAKDLSNDDDKNSTYKSLGIKLLNDQAQSELSAVVGKDETDYKTAYSKVASSNNTYFAQNNISGDPELAEIFASKSGSITEGANGARFIRKPIYIGYGLLDLARWKSDFSEKLNSDNGGDEVTPGSDNYSLVRMRYNYIGDMTDNVLEGLGKRVQDALANPTIRKELTTTSGVAELFYQFMREYLGVDSQQSIDASLGELQNILIKTTEPDGVRNFNQKAVQEVANNSIYTGNYTLMDNVGAEVNKSKDNNGNEKNEGNDFLAPLTSQYQTNAYYGLPANKDTGNTKIWKLNFNAFSMNRAVGTSHWLSSLIGKNTFTTSVYKRVGLSNSTTHSGVVSDTDLGEFANYNGVGRASVISHIVDGESNMASTIKGDKLDIINDASFYNSSTGSGSLINAVSNYVLNNAITQGGSSDSDKAKVAPDDGTGGGGGYAQGIAGKYGNAQVIWGTAMPMDIVFVTEQETSDGVELVPLESLSDENDYTILPEQFWVTPGFESFIHINETFNIPDSNNKDNPIKVKVKSAAVKPAAIDTGEFIKNYEDALTKDVNGENSTHTISMDKVSTGSTESTKDESMYSRIYYVSESDKDKNLTKEQVLGDRRISITDASSNNMGSLVRADSTNYFDNTMNMVATVADKNAYIDNPKDNRLQLVCVVSINEKPVQYNVIEDENGKVIDIQKVAQNRDSSGNLILSETVSTDKTTSIPEVESLIVSPTDYKIDEEEDTIDTWKKVQDKIKDPDKIPDYPDLTEIPEDILEQDDFTEDVDPEDIAYVRYICYPPQYNIYRMADGTEIIQKVTQNWNNNTIRLKQSIDKDNVSFSLKQWGLSGYNNNPIANVSGDAKYRYWDYVINNMVKVRASIKTTFNDKVMNLKNTDAKEKFGGLYYGIDPRNGGNIHYSYATPYIQDLANKKDKNTVYVLYVEIPESEMDGFNILLNQNMLTRRVSYTELLNSRYLISRINGVDSTDDNSIEYKKTFYLNLVDSTGFTDSRASSVSDETEYGLQQNYKRHTYKEEGSENKTECFYNLISNWSKSYSYNIGMHPSEDNKNNPYSIGIDSNTYSDNSNPFGWYSAIQGKQNIENSLQYYEGEETTYVMKDRDDSLENSPSFNPKKGVLGDLWAEKTKYYNVYGDKDTKYVPYIIVWRGSDRPTLVNDTSLGGMNAMIKQNASTGDGYVTISKIGSSTGVGLRATTTGPWLGDTATSKETARHISLRADAVTEVINGSAVSVTRAKASAQDKYTTTFTYMSAKNDTSGTEVKEEGGFRIPMELQFGDANGTSITYKEHRHSYKRKTEEDVDRTQTLGGGDLSKDYSSKNELSGYLHVRSFIGPSNQGTATAKQSYSDFKIGNNTYNSDDGFAIQKNKIELGNFDFYPYLNMKYDVSNPSVATGNAKVWSELKSTIKGTDMLEVGVKLPTGSGSVSGTITSNGNKCGRLVIESDMWSTHTKASTLSDKFNSRQTEPKSAKIKVLPGGAIYRLKCGASETVNGSGSGQDGTYPNNTKIGIKGYFVFVPEDTKLGYTPSDQYNLEKINSAYASMVERAKKSLETVDVLCWIDKSSDGKGTVNGTDDSDKYNLKRKVDTSASGMADISSDTVHVADLNVINKPNTGNDGNTYYRVWSEVDSAGVYKFYVGSSKSDYKITTMRSSLVSQYAPTSSQSSNNASDVQAVINALIGGNDELKRLDDATSIITNYVKSVDFGLGSSVSEITKKTEYSSKTGGEMTIEDKVGHPWYNEESLGLCVVVKDTEFVLGFGPSGTLGSGSSTTIADGKATRTAAINPVDTPARANTSDAYSKGYIAWFQTENHSYYNSSQGKANKYLTTFKFSEASADFDINLGDGVYSRLYRSENIVLPNATVMDLS